MKKEDLIKINDYIWEIPIRRLADGSDMRVPGRIFISEKMLTDAFRDQSMTQVINVAALPGIYKWSLAMPDLHEGYGFPIGGVAAFDIEKGGVISPGGVGFDINCGVRILKTGKKYEEIKDKIPDLAALLFREIPSGVGKSGKLKLSNEELDLVLKNGVDRMIELGYATKDDKKHCEEGGHLEGANPEYVSSEAKARGHDQLGTMGAGNHFVEVQKVEKIFDKKIAKEMGLFEGQVTIMIHCGSRGLGHQVATDYIDLSLRSMGKYGIKVIDRQLSSVPFSSPEGQKYWGAMQAAANFAWANRQLITYSARNVWKKIFGNEDLKLIYDVAHNLAKLEEYDGKKLIVHRKGATRSFPGEPVLIPGSMGTASYVLIGSEDGMELSFGSACHGAGRVMSRTQAKRQIRGSALKEELEKEGIIVRSGSMSGLAEEAPLAYKDVEEVVNVVHNAGLAKKVARLKPVAVIKG